MHDSSTAAYVPTPEEIRQGCLAVQRTWSPATRESRRVGYAHQQRKPNPIPGADTYRAEPARELTRTVAAPCEQ